MRAHSICEDFFGRVKNKAEDMEKKLKEKDKHGLLLRNKNRQYKIYYIKH